jgi:hypothetical protein
VMYKQLTLVIYYSALCILTSAILFHCHEEPCSISMDTAEAATHAEWAACTISLTDPNHFDCVVLLPIPSPSCSLLVQWVTYFYEFSSFTMIFKHKIPTYVDTHMCMCDRKRRNMMITTSLCFTRMLGLKCKNCVMYFEYNFDL